jgi:WD40 repeat protein
MTGSSDSTVRIWDRTDYSCVNILIGHALGVLDICSDERYIVTCSKDYTLRVWHKDSHRLYRVLSGHRGPVNAARLQGNRIASASGDSLMKCVLARIVHRG